jgi:diguanylate cyclase (GGDEF)-like protein/PAS domain S-box-containing protein
VTLPLTLCLAVTLFAAVILALYARAQSIRARDATRALTENQMRLLKAERLARVGYWDWDAKSEVLFLSPQAAALSGMPAGKQLLTRDNAEAAAATAEGRFLSRIVYVLSSGKTSRVDSRIKLSRGDVWLHSIVQPAFDSNGRICGVFGTLQDVTGRKTTENELRALKTDYAALLDHLPAAVSYMDSEGRFLMVNEATLRQSGYPRERFEGRLFSEIHPQGAAERLNDNLEVIRSETPKLGRIECMKNRHGEERWLQVDKIPKRDAHGRVVGVVIITVDVTQRKLAEDRLRALTAEREMLLNRIPAFVIYKDRAGYIVHANRMTATLAGRRLETLVGMHGSQVFAQADPAEIARIDAEVLSTGQPKHGIVEKVTRADGSKQYFEIEVLPNPDCDGRVAGLVVFGMDITERRLAEHRAEFLVTHDPLTGLWNRRALGERLEQALESYRTTNRGCALLFVDLDYFKRANDTHGHEVGDQLLIQSAARLNGCVRPEDMVVRMGGDEFVVLLTEVSTAAEAVVVARRVRAALAEPFRIRGVVVTIGSSVGAANCPEHASTAQALMQAADSAMYEAKAAGRDTIRVYAPVCDDAAVAS